MKSFDLNYNLFEKEIEGLSHLLMRATSGYGEYEGDDGWLYDSESIDILNSQLDKMKENRNVSKKIILDVLNDKKNKYPYNVKLFYISHNFVLNDKNKLIYDGNNVNDTKNIFKDIIVDYFNKNNFVYQDNIKDIINSIIKNDKVEEFAKKLVDDVYLWHFEKCDGILGNVIQDYINNNTKLCIEMFGAEKENNIQDEETKIHNQKDFEKLNEFANKLGKDELNELQNILIQCEYDDKVLSDFTSAVNKIVVNKNLANDEFKEEKIHNNACLIYDTKEQKMYDISIIDNKGNSHVSFEKYSELLRNHNNNDLIMIKAKDTNTELSNYEKETMKAMLYTANYYKDTIMDVLVVNTNDIKYNNNGEYIFKEKSNISCYSNNYNETTNLTNHINKLIINNDLKKSQSFNFNQNEINSEKFAPKLK